MVGEDDPLFVSSSRARGPTQLHSIDNDDLNTFEPAPLAWLTQSHRASPSWLRCPRDGGREREALTESGD